MYWTIIFLAWLSELTGGPRVMSSEAPGPSGSIPLVRVWEVWDDDDDDDDDNGVDDVTAEVVLIAWGGMEEVVEE